VHWLQKIELVFSACTELRLGMCRNSGIPYRFQHVLNWGSFSSRNSNIRISLCTIKGTSPARPSRVMLHPLGSRISLFGSHFLSSSFVNNCTVSIKVLGMYGWLMRSVTANSTKLMHNFNKVWKDLKKRCLCRISYF